LIRERKRLENETKWLAVDIRPVQFSPVMVVDLLIWEAGMRFFSEQG